MRPIFCLLSHRCMTRVIWSRRSPGAILAPCFPRSP